jgi:hypothetical protein
MEDEAVLQLLTMPNLEQLNSLRATVNAIDASTAQEFFCRFDRGI